MARTASRQHGAALLLFLLVVVVFGTSVWLAQARRPIRPEPGSRHRPYLAEAKAQLLMHALANPVRPGWLPYPDRNGDGDYDGNGDCINGLTVVNGRYLIGQWPFLREHGCAPPGSEPNAFFDRVADADGNRLWIAISSNLVWNRSVIDDVAWLSVRTPHGLMTDLAAVIFSPGPELMGQNRAGAAPITQFLDSVILAGRPFSNADGDLQFVAAAMPGHFNDVPIYVTRSEFMTSVTRTVATAIQRAIDMSGPYPVSLPDNVTPWFAPFWRAPVTSYTRLSSSAATLVFAGCPDVTYRLSTGSRLKWNGRC